MRPACETASEAALFQSKLQLPKLPPVRQTLVVKRHYFRFAPGLFALASSWLCGACSTQQAPPTSSLAPPVDGRANGNEAGEGEPVAHRVQQAPLSSGPASSSTPPIQLRHPRGKTPWLGVELRKNSPHEAGVQVTRVLPGSPAERSRLQPGDVLLSFGATTLNSPSEVAQAVRDQQSGTRLPLAFLRGKSNRLVQVELEGMPDFEDRLRLAFVGRSAPPINGVVAFQGDVASLKDLEGEVVLLEFWATYCGVCRILAPTLERWQHAYSSRGMTVLGITMDDPGMALRAARRDGMTYALASDPDSRITKKYSASQIPAVLVIDRRGFVADVMVGYSPERMLETEALIERLLAQDLPSP